MSRRTNMLLVLALATGVGYGYVGVPFLLPVVPDGIEVAVEEAEFDWLSEADQVRFRMRWLKLGMNQREVENLFGLSEPYSTQGTPNHLVRWYHISPDHILRLHYGTTTGLLTAKLRSGDRLVKAWGSQIIDIENVAK